MIQFILQLWRKMLVKHWMISFFITNMNLKCFKIHLFYFFEIDFVRFVGYIDTTFSCGSLKLDIKHSLVYLILSAFDFFSFVCVLKKVKYTKWIDSQFKHFEIGFDFVLGLLSELHLLLLSFSESGVLVYIIKICFLPENSEEGSFSLLALTFPVLIKY